MLRIVADLQVHLFDQKLWLPLIEKMEAKSISLVSVLTYKWGQTKKFKEFFLESIPEFSNYVISLEKNVLKITNMFSKWIGFIVLGEEIISQNGWHVLSTGLTGFSEERPENLEGLIEEVLKRGGLPIIDHPYADSLNNFNFISPEKIKELNNVCEKFKGEIALEWNGMCIGWVRKLIGYGSVNDSIEIISGNYNIPLISTTDLHVRKKGDLKNIGTSNISLQIEGDNVLDSLKEKILSRRYYSEKKCVSLSCFLTTFGFPYLWKLIRKK